MKAISLTLVVVGTFSLVFATTHKHAHHHAHGIKRRASTTTSWAAGPTVYEIFLEGQQISAESMRSGIAAHVFSLSDTSLSDFCLSTSSSPTKTVDISGTSWNSPSGTHAAQVSPGTSHGNVLLQGDDWNSNISDPSQIRTPFPDGELDCSTFPSRYGAVALDYLGLGGWTGIQSVTFGENAITNIVTGIPGNTCSEGDMCSYACPAGYQKSQWPGLQGATDQSIGGVLCSDGKLRLTNPALSQNLCIEGMGGVQVVNNAADVISICRTDYPGTESETIPVEVQPGQSQPLANPDAATYYKWEGASTSAQYYLNPIGIVKEEACRWGDAGTDVGNYAPINFGVGYKDGRTWLGLFQNAPSTFDHVQGSVWIEGDVSDSCRYSNGQYCSSGGCNDKGCTASTVIGAATLY